LLIRVLQSLAHQTLQPEEYEIVIVDDGSTDNTAEICAALGQEMPNMRYISTASNAGLGSAANLGVKSAKGEYLIFTDDDCIPREDWAENMRDALIEYPIVAGSVLSPTSNYCKLCHNIAEFHPFMEGRKAGPIDFIAGANMGFRRPLFEEVNGFPAGHVLAPDMQLILKARKNGYTINFVPGAVVIHDHGRTSFSGIFQYAAQHASESIHLRNKYRDLLHTPFIFNSPLLILAAAPVIALKVTAIIYLGNTQNIRFIMTAPVVYALKLAWCWGAARSLRTMRKKDSN